MRTQLNINYVLKDYTIRTDIQWMRLLKITFIFLSGATMNLFVILVAFLLANCSTSNFEGRYEGSSSNAISDYQSDAKKSEQIVGVKEKANNEEGRTARSDSDLLGGGDGVTIGNGQNSEEEIEEEISEPIMVTGHFLTSCQVSAEVVSCSIDPDFIITQADLARIILMDENGEIIPNADLEFETVTRDGENVLDIYYPEEYLVTTVITDAEESQTEATQEPEANPTEPPQEEAVVIDNRRCAIEILETGISANLNCSEAVPWIMYGGIRVGGDVNAGNHSIVKSTDTRTITFTGLDNLQGSITLIFETQNGEESEIFTYQELRGE